MSFETPTAPPAAPPTNQNHPKNAGRSWDCLAYDRKGRFLVPSRFRRRILGSQKANLQKLNSKLLKKKWEEFQSWNFPLWNKLQISTKKPHPPRPNFFWYIPWDFPWKNHGCLEHDRSSLALENFSNGKTLRGWCFCVEKKPAGMLERSTVSFMVFNHMEIEKTTTHLQ